MKKRGQGEIIAIVLIIVLVLVAIALLWNPIKNLITNSLGKTSKIDCMDLNFEISAQWLDGTTTDNLVYTVLRKSGGPDAEVTLVHVVGGSIIAPSGLPAGDATLGQLESSKYNVTTLSAKPSKIEIGATFTDTDGKPRTCEIAGSTTSII